MLARLQISAVLFPRRSRVKGSLLGNGHRTLVAGAGRFVAIAIAFFVLARQVHSEPVLQEGFEADTTRWHVLDNDETTAARIREHDVVHVNDARRPDSRAERIVLETPGGSSIECEYVIGQAPILDELRANLWVKANRPGVILAARVVLPRAIDPESGEFRTVLVRGTSYEAVSTWQRLELAEVTTLVKRRVRVLRLETESPIDHREAYVESLVLIVPGGTGGTEVLTDDLELYGVLLAVEPSTFPSSNDPRNSPHPVPTGVVQVGWDDDHASPADSPPQRLPPRVQVRSSIVQIDGRPFFPRAVTHQGESLEQLAELGFNTILFPARPSAELQEQLEKLQLWQILPPPSADELASPALPSAAQYRRVLGWYLDAHAAALPPGQLQLWMEAIRRWDEQLDRPIFLDAPAAVIAQQSRADAVVLGRAVWNHQFDLRRHGRWLSEQTMLTGPGAPILMSFELAPTGLTRAQAAAFSNIPTEGASAVGVDESQINTHARIAVSNGCRGIIVRATESLASDDPVTRRRAKSLTLTNLQLELLEPWLVGGKVIGVATSSNPEVSAVLLQVEHARIVVPMHWPDAGGATATALTVPGVPESSRVYLLTPANLTPLDHKRVAGGIRVIFDPGSEGFIVLTEDPSVISSLWGQVARIGGRAAQLRRDIAADRLEIAKPLLSGGGTNDASGSVEMQLLSRAGGHLGESHRQLQAGNVAAAYQHATRASQLTQQPFLRRLLPSHDSTLITSYPLRPTLDGLSSYTHMLRSLSTRPPGANRLYGGDFEDLQRLMEFGWKHISHAAGGTQTQVELSKDRPQHGSYCLQLSAKPADPEHTPSVLAEPPLWIDAPAVQVHEGELLEIIGWLRIDEPLTAHADGIAIVDSLGGPQMAIMVQQTSGWQPFRMIRYVASPGKLRLRFLLHGLGTACVDAVMIRPLGPVSITQQAKARVLPQPSETRRTQQLIGQPRLR